MKAWNGGRTFGRGLDPQGTIDGVTVLDDYSGSHLGARLPAGVTVSPTSQLITMAKREAIGSLNSNTGVPQTGTSRLQEVPRRGITQTLLPSSLLSLGPISSRPSPKRSESFFSLKAGAGSLEGGGG